MRAKWINCQSHPTNGGKDMMHEWWDGWGPGGWGGVWFGPVIWLVLLTLFIIGIASFWRRSANNGETVGPHSRTPRQILNERFAKGEIDKDEYEDRLRALRE
jgi:putative membrane protein